MKVNKKRVLTGAVVVAATAAVILVAAPKASQAAEDLFTGKDVKDQSLYSVDIAEGGVGYSEVRNGSLTGSDLNPNTVKRFLAGERAQVENDAQDAKIDSLEDRVEAEETEGDTVGLNESRAGAGYTKFAAPGYSVQWAKCSGGKVAISGGYRLNGHASEAFSGADQNAMPEGLTVVATEPAAEKGGVLVNSYNDPDFPQTPGGSFQANAWAVTFLNTDDEPKPVRIWVTCVNAD